MAVTPWKPVNRMFVNQLMNVLAGLSSGMGKE
jgi:hypothetical protein